MIQLLSNAVVEPRKPSSQTYCIGFNDRFTLQLDMPGAKRRLMELPYSNLITLPPLRTWKSVLPSRSKITRTSCAVKLDLSA